jgi:hypothetical protein
MYYRYRKLSTEAIGCIIVLLLNEYPISHLTSLTLHVSPLFVAQRNNFLVCEEELLKSNAFETRLKEDLITS